MSSISVAPIQSVHDKSLAELGESRPPPLGARSACADHAKEKNDATRKNVMSFFILADETAYTIDTDPVYVKVVGVVFVIYVYR